MDVQRAPLILVIDDSPTVCKIIEIALHREGYEVMTFADGVAALGWLASSGGCIPALIFLDVEMPKMNTLKGTGGYTLKGTGQMACYLRSKPRFAQTVIIMMSRRDGVVERLKSKLVGVKEYVGKPFTTQVLVQLVLRYLGPSPSSMSSQNH